jgi:hypothetical protein
VRLLLREPAADEPTARGAAGEAGWPLPRSLAVLAIAGDARNAAAARLPPDTISEAIGGDLVCALVPDPDGPGRRSAVERAILDAGASGGLGTSVRWPDAAISFARARGALALISRAPGLAVARERTGELLLRSDRGLAEELAHDRLAPLAELPAGSRARLTETLRVWLEEQGRLGRVAKRLRVHPQTARYRLTRLRELFGDSLDDPEQRFWLSVALRVSAG